MNKNRTLKKAVKTNSIIMATIAVILLIVGAFLAIQTVKSLDSLYGENFTTLKEDLVERCNDGQSVNSGACDVLAEGVALSNISEDRMAAHTYAIMSEFAIILGLGTLIACFMYRNHALAEK